MVDIQTHLKYKPPCTPTLTSSETLQDKEGYIALLELQLGHKPPYEGYEMGEEEDEIKEEKDLADELMPHEGSQMTNNGSCG